MLFNNWLNIFDGSSVNIWVAFAAGFLTFFASCLLPLLPSYLVYISGLSYSQVLEAKGKVRRDIIINCILFTLGFVIAFVILGSVGNSIYNELTSYKRYFEIFAGILFILLGLFNLDLLSKFGLTSVSTILDKEVKINTRNFLTKSRFLNSIILGLGFGLAWTPCIGPTLGVILYWATKADTWFKGVSLLTTFGIGMGLPFIIMGAGAEYILEKFKYISLLNKVLGVIILLLGIKILIQL